jgi:hypothetical protein
LKLDVDQFEEEFAGAIAPDAAGRYPAGLHTINGFGDWTIVDGARWTFVTAEMRRALRRKFGQPRQ